MDGHEHAGLTGRPAADGDRRWLTSALILIGGFMAAEVIVGVVAHSLALLSDAAHMLIDAGAIVLALTAMRLGLPGESDKVIRTLLRATARSWAGDWQVRPRGRMRMLGPLSGPSIGPTHATRG